MVAQWARVVRGAKLLRLLVGKSGYSGSHGRVMRDCRYDNGGQAGLHIYSEKWQEEIAGSGRKKWREDRRREDRGGKNWREEIRREKINTKQNTDNSKKIKKMKNLCT
jgi:hypothetical protein